MSVAALVLAAGASSRFGSPKALAAFEGRPLLEHVLDAVREAGIEEIVVVLGHAAEEIEEGIEWLSERRVRNPDPRHLASSLQVGIAAIAEIEPPVRGVVIALGDQPLTRPEVIRALVGAARTTDRPVVVPHYADGGGANPVFVRASAFELVDEAVGDRGLGPILAEDPEQVLEVVVSGSNPDVDTPADLAELVWAERVRANREQVDRVREAPDGADFYAPVSRLFRADPDRSDDPVVAELLALAKPDETWIDIGAGAGRYALPLARAVAEVIAIEPSSSMLAALGEVAASHSVTNLRAIDDRWPMSDPPIGDVALIAHVGYDIEPIGQFLVAMEASARRLCVAVLMERSPASAADRFWPIVHGESRLALPALPDFVELLRARGREPAVTMLERPPRHFDERAQLEGFVRRQLWIADGGEKERRFRAAFEELIVENSDGTVSLAGQEPSSIGIVTWTAASWRD
jgi:CTP:molybdopterin cytidylyltransferase MocA